MAIAFGNATSTSSRNTQTASLVAPSISGSDTLLVLSNTMNVGASFAYAAVTYNSADITGNLVSSQFVNFVQTDVWYVKAPTSAATFTVDLAGTDVGDYVLTAAYYTGVDQSTSYRTVSTATGTTLPATVDITNAQSGDIIHGVFGLNDTTSSDGLTEANIGAGQTFILTTQEPVGNATQGAICRESGSTAVTHSWTFVENADNGWTVSAIPLIPTASSSGAEKKISQFDALTDPIATDVLCIVDSTTSPASAKLTIDNLLDLFISNVTMTVLTATSGATYAPPAEAKKLLICVVGGGGGGNGGAATDSAGGGGGGGGTAIKMVSSTAVTSGVYVVGPGGGVSSAGTANAGVASKFTIDAATTMSGGGGGAGTQGAIFSVVGVSVAGGVGGTAANGDLNIPGMRGERGVIYSGTNGYAGSGGDSVFGFGSGSAGVNTTGSPGGSYGGGGCGGHASLATNKEGAAGAKGTVFILEFYG